MTRYQCISCEAIQTTTRVLPDACPHCAGPVFDLDRYEAARAEARIIGAADPSVQRAMADYQARMAQEVERKDEALRRRLMGE